MRQKKRCAALLAVLLAVPALSGCADISKKFAATASQMPGIGLSPEAPPRPEVEGAYPAVHDMPAPRTNPTLTDVEQEKIEGDLVAARDRQQAAAGVAPPDRKPKPAPPRRVVPVSSGQSIY